VNGPAFRGVSVVTILSGCKVFVLRGVLLACLSFCRV